MGRRHAPRFGSLGLTVLVGGSLTSQVYLATLTCSLDGDNGKNGDEQSEKDLHFRYVVAWSFEGTMLLDDLTGLEGLIYEKFR